MDIVLRNYGVLLHGVFMMLSLTGAALAFAFPLGIGLAIMRLSPVGPLRAVGTLYVDIFRNTPLTVIFFFSAFILPTLGLSFSYFAFSVIALAVYYTAFYGEALRSGVNMVPPGQIEAARAIGLSFTAILRFVILPQALRHAFAPLVNVTLALVKSTAIASAFGVAESVSVMELLILREGDAVFAILMITCLLYLALTLPLALIAAAVERRMGSAR